MIHVIRTPLASNDMLESLAQVVLDARVAYPDATLADLYDSDLMPPSLRRAHWALGPPVDRLYRRAGFALERGHTEQLFILYERMRPLGIVIKKLIRRKRRLNRTQHQSRRPTLRYSPRQGCRGGAMSSYVWDLFFGGRI